ncbi:MAG: type III pantothenate kinase [Rhodospirillaceae bacterium]|nr:type III pantothenate kinase [Rhodospirillaceae bacterium]
MLLAINANNTNVKFAAFDGERRVGAWAIRTERNRTADEYVVWLSQLMGLSGLRLADIDDAIIATVVPQALFHLRMLCERHLGTRPLVVGEPEVELGIAVRMDMPAHEVGADRLANAVGAHVLFRRPLIVLDFGTATTFDVVAGDGSYLGGVIAPGINLSLEALHSATAKLPRIAVERPRRVVGKDTLGAMQSGIYWGYIGLIEGVVARIREEAAEPLLVAATGGLAPLFFGATPAIDRHEPEITMRGLVEIHRRNRGGRP